jgi:enamine deaminase RidA (YjgF/YER057c/UK114 family)
MKRLRFSSGAPWEPIVGYSRSVRVGPHVFVTGCTAIDASGAVVGKGDPYAQAVQTLKNVERALRGVGAELHHVTRTRMFVTDISQWETIGKAHGEVFGEILPATSMIEIAGLIDPDMLVEIEADAIVDE